MSGAVSYDLVLDGALVPITDLKAAAFLDSPDIPFYDTVTFAGSPAIAAAEGSASSGILIYEYIGRTQVGSALFSGNPFSYVDTFDLAKTPGQYEITAFATVSGEFDAVNGYFDSARGALLGQTTTDNMPIRPFSSVSVIDDYDPADFDPFQSTPQHVVAVTSGSARNGVLSDPNRATDGGSFYDGAYVLRGSAAALTADVQGLVFTPTAHQVAPGKTVTTSFTITEDSEYTEVASVVVTGTRYPNVPEIVGPAAGHAVLNGPGSDDQIVARGVGNLILTNGGQDYVDGGAGSAVVLGAGGDKMIALGGDLNVVDAGGGDDVVSGAPGGLTAVTLGNGDDVVTLGGSLDHVVLGNANDAVSLTGGMSFVSVGSGTDMLTVGGPANEIKLGVGVDTVVATGKNNIFVLPTAFDGSSEIVGFSISNGDRLDLRPALAAMHWNGSMSTLGRYLQVSAYTASTAVAITPPGSATNVNDDNLRLVESGRQTLGSLLAHHSLIV